MKHIIRASTENVHWGYYDSRLKPILKIRSGDTLEVYTVSGSQEIIEFLGISDKIPDELNEIFYGIKDRGPGSHLLVGPVYVEGATTDDTLEITLIEIEPWTKFGINFFSSNRGIIPEDFPYLRAKYIPIEQRRSVAIFSENVEIPLAPFFGHLGVAPLPQLGRITSTIPGSHGGNLDNKELVASTKVYLPIHREGAFFSIGDGHACQGDGEANQTALETCMRGLLKLRVIKKVKIQWPMADCKDYFMFMGFHPDLDEAFKMALRNVIEFLVNKGFNKDDAYMLCSLGIDFHITQVVNQVKGVHAQVPKKLFRDSIHSII